MVINEDEDWYFYHIMKCGGTSIRKELNKIPGSKDSRQLRLYKHREVRFLPKIDQKDVFTVVRNPWERFHSLYWDIKTRFRSMHETEQANLEYKRWYLEMAEQVDSMDFSDWILNGHYIHPAEYGYNSSPLNTLDKSMSYYIEGQEMTVFRLEDNLWDLDAWFDNQYGFSVTRENVSKRPAEYRPDYTDKAKDKVANVCKEDIERWGYDF